MIKRLGLLAIGLTLPASAFAWKHTLIAWIPDEDFPLEYQVADYCEDSVPSDYCVVAAKQGYDAWLDAPCAEVSSVNTGTCPNVGYTYDFNNWITFDDPAGENGVEDIPEPATLAATLTRPSGTAFILDGTTYSHAVDSDIVFNDNTRFATHEDIDSGNCGGGTNMRAVMTHEIGHLLGLGHSCEQEEVCLDPLLANAAMFWSDGPCSLDQSFINEDDIEGITSLYGPFATFTCSHLLDPDEANLAIGVVPFTLKCTIISDYLEEIVEAEWNWGDGGTSDDIDYGTVKHTYEEPGNYTVRVKFTGERDGCGNWDYDFRKVGFVRACGVPEAAFEVEHLDGLTYTFLNETDISVYGCIDDITWDVFKGTNIKGAPIASIAAWEPDFEFPEAGEYTVVLNVGGRAGTGAAKLTFDAKKQRGDGRGCDNVGAVSGASVAGLIALGALGLRRRRE